MRIHRMAQLRPNADGTFDAHFTFRTDERDAKPDIRSYRYISAASVERFFAISGGYFTAYGDKERGE